MLCQFNFNFCVSLQTFEDLMFCRLFEVFISADETDIREDVLVRKSFALSFHIIIKS